MTVPEFRKRITGADVHGNANWDDLVAFNRIEHFHDGINIETYGNPDGSAAAEGEPKYPARELWNRRPVAIDFYNNDITSSHDNPIEADGGMHNIRVLRNMFINHPSHAFCNQPVLGGPAYWIRNSRAFKREVGVAPASFRRADHLGGQLVRAQVDERALARAADLQRRRQLRQGDRAGGNGAQGWRVHRRLVGRAQRRGRRPGLRPARPARRCRS